MRYAKKQRQSAAGATRSRPVQAAASGDEEKAKVPDGGNARKYRQRERERVRQSAARERVRLRWSRQRRDDARKIREMRDEEAIRARQCSLFAMRVFVIVPPGI